MTRYFIDLIKSSLQSIDTSYYRLITSYNSGGIIRERVFCYELYHQMRLRMQNNDILNIHGEVDKRGHTRFNVQDRKNPDFIFHIPGTDDFNTLVVEVKGTLEYDRVRTRSRLPSRGSSNRRASTAVNDIKTLLRFVESYSYAAGVFILYNHSFEEFQTVLGERIELLQGNRYASHIHILTIDSDTCRCEEHILHNLQNVI